MINPGDDQIEYTEEHNTPDEVAPLHCDQPALAEEDDEILEIDPFPSTPW